MKKVFKIWNKKNKAYSGSYSRAYGDIYEFDSEDSALNHNCHGMFHDTDTYEIHEVEVTERLAKKLPPKEKHLKTTKESAERESEYKEYMKEHPQSDHFQAIMAVNMGKLVRKIDDSIGNK